MPEPYFEKDGCTKLNAGSVAKEAGVSLSLVRVHFPDRQNLYDSMFIEAVRVENLGIIAEGLEYKVPILSDIPDVLREKAIEHGGEIAK